VAVARRLLAIQAQDPRAARLAIRARATGVTASDVDRALTSDRSLVIDWLNRGTLHLICSEDYHWLHALTTPQLAVANTRRLAQEGVTPVEAVRGVAVIERSLSDAGPLTRTQLRERLVASGVRTEGQSLVQLLVLAALRGIILRGPMVGREQAFVLVRDWLGSANRVPREQAVAEMARRYLHGHGPADDRDLARWAGLPLRDARAGLRAISGELAERPGGLVDLKARPPAAGLPSPRLLGAFEPVLLGWRAREQILDGNEPEVVAGGVFRPIALVRGRAAATWSLRGSEVELKPFRRLAKADAAALREDARDVIRYLAADAAANASALASPGTAR